MTKSADALAERIFAAAIGSFEIAGVYLGDCLGWYRTLADDGPATPDEPAARTGTDARYARSGSSSRRPAASSRSTPSADSACPKPTPPYWRSRRASR